MSGLDYLYTKKQFNRIVKWCSEDPSNIWYDHMEQALADFAEARQIYKS
jgi:predicted transcriptional regulator